MASVHLPAEYDEHDLALAGALARVLDSEDLYVTWCRAAGHARPIVPATCEPRRRGRGLAGLLGALSRRR